MLDFSLETDNGHCKLRTHRVSFAAGLAEHSISGSADPKRSWPRIESEQPLFSLWSDAAEPLADLADPLASFVREISDACAADGICAVWHSSGSGVSPRILAAFHDDPAVEAVLLAAALRRHAPVNGPSWRGTAAGDLMHFDVIADGGHIALLALFRSPQRPTSGSPYAIERWLPIAHAFFLMWIARTQAESRASALTAAVNNGGVGIIVVDGSASVLFANDGATDMLDRRDGICRSGALVGGNRLADTLRLRSAIEHVMQTGHDDPHVSPVVALARTKGRPLLVAIVGVDRDVAGNREETAILYLFDPDQNIHPLAEPACRFYGLSPVETKLTCLLADGHSLADAAKSMRVREQTARSYLKQVFSKTATNRQGELVQLMLKSLVRTASRCVTRFI